MLPVGAINHLSVVLQRIDSLHDVEDEGPSLVEKGSFGGIAGSRERAAVNDDLLAEDRVNEPERGGRAIEKPARGLVLRHCCLVAACDGVVYA